jgi:hypothetical protein
VGQSVDVVMNYLRAHPEARHYPASARRHLACDVETLRDSSFPPRPIAAPSPLLWIETLSPETLHKLFYQSLRYSSLIQSVSNAAPLQAEEAAMRLGQHFARHCGKSIDGHG